MCPEETRLRCMLLCSPFQSDGLTIFLSPSQASSGANVNRPDFAALLHAHRPPTLAGAGGCGKTRLALEAAARHLPLFRDGVWLTDLAPWADEPLVAETVAGSSGCDPMAPNPSCSGSMSFGTRSVLLSSTTVSTSRLLRRVGHCDVRPGAAVRILKPVAAVGNSRRVRPARWRLRGYGTRCGDRTDPCRRRGQAVVSRASRWILNSCSRRRISKPSMTCARGSMVSPSRSSLRRRAEGPHDQTDRSAPERSLSVAVGWRCAGCPGSRDYEEQWIGVIRSESEPERRFSADCRCSKARGRSRPPQPYAPTRVMSLRPSKCCPAYSTNRSY